MPPSLVNIFKEIQNDLGTPPPDNGDLTRWADQGVLLLNATLTVRAHAAASHQRQGWEEFTDAVIRELNTRRDNLVFILWGSYAQRKGAIIDRQRHLVLSSVHPSPLSAHAGFFGNHHFSRANAYLAQHGQTPIQW
jgi:uracil-DNA glycosylase